MTDPIDGAGGNGACHADLSEPADVVARARSLTSAEEAARFYDEWAPSYDADVFTSLGFVGSSRIAELLAEVLPDPHLPVVDLGCGTGAVGRRLAELGLSTIDGIDVSAEMLRVADATGAYRQLTVADLNALPDGPNDRYAASVSAGTFTTGHVGPDAVPRLIDMLRPDGWIAWVIATPMWPRFEPVLASRSLEVLHQEAEPIRRDGPPEAVMFVARWSP